MSASRIITPAEKGEILTVSDFKAHLNLAQDYCEQDSDLRLKLLTGQADIEERTGRLSLISAVLEMRLRHWPCGDIEIDVPQASEIVSIKFMPAGGVEQTVSSSIYKLVGGYDLTNSPTQRTGQARICLAYGQSWPSETLDTGEPIGVRYKAGYKDADSIPFQLRAAVLLQAAHLYQHREAVTMGNTAVESKVLADGVDRLIAPFIAWGF